MGVRKKLAKIMKIKPEDVDDYLVNIEGSVKLEWDFLKFFISGHMKGQHYFHVYICIFLYLFL